MNKIILGILLIGFTTIFANVNIASCTGCHGKNFEKSAMGKSKIVADMSKEDVSNALLGYKTGTYGGAMKNVMKAQISKYSNDELENTGIGKDTFADKVKAVAKETLEKTKKTVEKSKIKVTAYFEEKEEKTEIVFSEFEKIAYKSGDNCWVVDYKNKKSNSASCKILDERSKVDRYPTVPGMPSFVFRDLFN